MTSLNAIAANKALDSKVMDAVFVRRDSSVVEPAARFMAAIAEHEIAE